MAGPTSEHLAAHATQPTVLRGTDDPGATELEAEGGTLYIRDNAGTFELWFKVGAADDAWVELT